MKNQIKNLSKTLIASTVLTLAAGSAFAETLGATGTVTAAATCTLRFFASAAPNTPVTSVTLPTGTTITDLGRTVGHPTSNNSGTEFSIKAQTSTGAACNTGTTPGVVVTQFNTTWAATGTPIVVPGFGSKAANTVTAGAANVTIDLIPSGTGAKTTGLDLAGADAAAQHGLGAANLATGQTFTAKYIKTNTTIATAGTVTVSYTVTAGYL